MHRKLALSQARLRISELEKEVSQLKNDLSEHAGLLRETNRLLIKHTPSRPRLSSDQKMLLAAKANFADTVENLIVDTSMKNRSVAGSTIVALSLWCLTPCSNESTMAQCFQDGSYV